MNKLSYRQTLFVVLATVSIFVSAVCLWATHYFVVNQTQAEYFSRYKSLSRVLGNNLGQLEKSAELLMYAAVQNVRSEDTANPNLTNDELKLLAAKLNVTHIFVINSEGRFIRSTNEDPSLIPNLFGFCDKHRQLISGDATSAITPIIPPKPEPNPYKFVLVPSVDRKRILEVGLKAEFISNTLASTLREDLALEELHLFAPDGTSLGSIMKNPPPYKRTVSDLSDLKWDEPIVSGNKLTFYSRLNSTQPSCCQCDQAKLSKAGEYYYILKTTTSLDPLKASLHDLMTFFLTVQIVLLICCLIVAHFLSARLVSKINRLTSVVRSITRKKDVSQRVPSSSGPTELIELSNSFNDLLSTLQSAQRQLVEAKKDQAEVAVIRQVAHDIRAPLSALQIVSSKLSNLPTETSLLLNKACERIQRIAEDLVQRQTRGSHTIGKSVPTLLAALINDATEEAKMRFPNLSVDFVRDEDSFRCFAHIDPVSFKRVLSNMIDNSIEASDENTEIKISLIHRSKLVSVIIEDNGHGFDPSVLDAIGKERISSKTGGHGLGLSSAFTLIQAWSGELRIENLTPRGARVIITLPLAKDIDLINDFFVQTGSKTDSTVV